MDDKTVFQNQNSTPSNPWVPKEATQQPQEPISSSSSVPLEPVEPVSSNMPFAKENPFEPEPIQAQVYKPSQASSNLPPPPPSSTFSVSNIIKIIIGIFAVSLVAFLIIKVIPGFFGKGSSEVTLTYWGLWEDGPTMNTAIADFERQNPNIKVKYSKQDIKQYREALSTRVQNGNGPDVFLIHNTWVPVLKELILPVSSDVITKEQFAKNYYPVAQSDLIKNGAIYALPSNMDNLAMYVNNNLFEAAGLSAPTNWQDFINYSRQLTVKDENGKIQTAGAALGTFDNVTHASDIISMLLVQNGANLLNLSKTPTQVNDALTFYTSFATGNGNIWDDTLDSSILAFEKGNLAMYFGYSWDYFAIKAANPNLSFSIVNVPSLPGQSQTIASYWANSVSVKSPHTKEALLFLKFISQKETEQKLFTTESKTRSFGQLYANVELGSSLKENALVYPFIAQSKNAVSSYFISDTYDKAINSQMNTYLGNAVRSILNGTSVQSATDTLSAGVNQVLSQYGQQ